MVGCGGSSNPGQGDVSGVIVDSQGNGVKNAHVYLTGSQVETYSSSTGTYVLHLVDASDAIIRAEVTSNGTRYYGQNVISVYAGERSKSCNIAVYPDTTIGGLNGYVNDRNGYGLQGARVFARPASGAVLSSAVAVTDDKGWYTFSGLADGVSYVVVANAGGYGTDSDTFTATSGQAARYDFTLRNPTNPTIAAPANLYVESWTSPASTRGGADSKLAVKVLKNLKHPSWSKRHVAVSNTRNTLTGGNIEIDLTWDSVSYSDLLGFGIFRGTSASSLQSAEFLRDPQAQFYADTDASTTEGQTWYYGATTLNTSYNSNTGAGQSAFSNIVSVTTLADLLGATANPATGPTISWQSVSGVASYTVYLFTDYPTFTVSNPPSQTTTGTSVSFSGTTLTSGHTYYYIILGENADSTAKTVSNVGSFVAQ